MVWIRRVAVFCFLVLLSMPGGAETVPLRFSLPPVLEALPIALAHEWGLFEAHGVSVELVGITDNQQRSAALMTGNLDGMMEDVTRSILTATTGADVVMTSVSGSIPCEEGFALALTSPKSFRLDSLDAAIAANYAIATIYRSDYEFLLDRLLDSLYGKDAESVRTMYFHDILQTATWFGAQTLPVAMLPEPYVTYIATYVPPTGGQPIELVIHDDFSTTGVLPAVTLFQRSYVEQNADAVRGFYAAYAEAVERINATPRDELIEDGIHIVVPLFFQGADVATVGQDVWDALMIPTFELPAALAEETFDEVLAWMIEKGYVYDKPTYEQLTDFQFLP
jgi:ABC-type nitrate/sulfonate/bicarbonate transport system substrate-binding protein